MKENQDDIGKMIQNWGETLVDPKGDEKVKKLLDLIPKLTSECLTPEQARAFASGDQKVLDLFGNHVQKCTDYCQKVVGLYEE